jgi:acetoin utilization protein AcuB
MSVSSPSVGDYMTACPESIQRTETLSRAHALMREHHVRHLPVMEGDDLVGIVSQRDLHLLETLQDVDPEQVSVDDAMIERPFVVAPSAPLHEVADDMARHKYGAAVVMDGPKVVGLFTLTDAVRALSELLARAA